MEISKVVVPAAGVGTRFLPYTKTIPREMLPLLDKPAIHYVVEEAFNAAIRQFIVITNKEKRPVIDYFDETLSTTSHEQEFLLSEIQNICKASDFCYVRQPEALGLGHAVWSARHLIQPKEYFGITLPDDIILAKNNPAIGQIMRVARQEKASVIAVQEVPAESLSSYGVIEIKKQITPNLLQISSIVEKPESKDAPSSLAVVGRYVLSQKIFPALDETMPYSIDKIDLSSAITTMIKNGEKVFAYKIQGLRYDIGEPVGFVKAIIGIALQNPAYAPHIKRFLRDLSSTDPLLFNVHKNIEQSV